MATAAMAANEVLARVRGRGYPLSGTRGTWVARFVAAFVIPHPAFAICHPASVICHFSFRIPHSAFSRAEGGPLTFCFWHPGNVVGPCRLRDACDSSSARHPENQGRPNDGVGGPPPHEAARCLRLHWPPAAGHSAEPVGHRATSACSSSPPWDFGFVSAPPVEISLDAPIQYSWKMGPLRILSRFYG